MDFVGPDGVVSRAAGVRTTRQLAATGETALLDYHLGAMRDLGAPPLLAGNGVELLIDGPSTYRATFAAIEAAKKYVLVESFIFEEAIEGGWLVGLHLSFSRLGPALAGAPVPWDWDALAAIWERYAEQGLAVPGAAPGPEALG